MNEVRLVGRLSVAPETKVMPSGDELIQLRLVVPRPERGHRRSGPGRLPTVDTIDVACWSGRIRARAAALAAGDEVEIAGELHRRFFRTPGGPQSRYEVEALTLRKRRSTSGGGVRGVEVIGPI